MRGTFFGIEIGRTGLSTAQFGLDTTGHNIANVDTAGYTRQRIVQTAYDPFATVGRFAPTGQGLVGGGVRVQILDQIRSAYLDRRFRTESNAHSYWETRSQSLSYIESFFDSVNEKTSINYSMAEFFRSMKILEEDPVSGAPRTLMQTTAMDLVQQLNMIHQGLLDLQESENRSVKTKVNEVNLMAADLVELNKAIYVFEVTGMIANDLRDKRNLLLDKLSNLIDIEYEEYPDPNNPAHDLFKVTIDGQTLVDHDWMNELAVRPEGGELNGIAEPGQKYDVVWINGYEYGVPIEGDPVNWDRIAGGEIKAHIDVRDGDGIRNEQWDPDSRSRGIPYYIEMINDLARALVKEINDVHIQGWSDNPEYSRSGINFFHEEPGWTTWVDSTNGARYAWNELTSRWEGAGGYIYQAANGQYTYNDGTDDNPLDFSVFERDVNLSNITAASIDLSDEIKASAFNIAVSSEFIKRAASGAPEETQRGNNEIITELYKIFSKTGISVLREDGLTRNIGSFDDYGTVIRFDLGNTLKTSKQTQETCRLLTLAAENQRTSVAGVSLDEEMVGMVKYQHAYNGASRVITAMDEMLDKLINGTGLVGR